MKNLAIQAENISKQYRLGEVGTGTLSHDLNRFWHKIRGNENPYLKIGESNDRSTKGNSDYVWSLQDINFEIEQGDAVGIIGRNGAGKSTLLKLLSKVTKPTTGSFKVNGRIASLLEVGTGFNPEMTGRENIYLNGAILGMRRHEITRKLDEIIDFSGVERYIDTPVKRYSSGMYVRLAFAVAAHLESEIMIVDEVLAVGDAEFQKKCLGKMGDVSKGEGRTVLFVSHNLGSVKNLCDKGVFLENGELKFKGEISDVIDLYQNTNLVTASIEKEFINDSQQPVFISKVELLVNNLKAKMGVVDFRDLLSFNVYITVSENVKNRGIVIHCNDNQDRLFQAFDISVHPEYFENRLPGDYLLNVQFEHAFLREGNYTFDFEVGHFGVGVEQLEKAAIGIHVEVLSRNPRFESATKQRVNKMYIDPKWTYNKI
jgi:lipopolysaccharide transport system ATP-binding protein